MLALNQSVVLCRELQSDIADMQEVVLICNYYDLRMVLAINGEELVKSAIELHEQW